ncbi:hypothetical protein AYI70_g6941, partial [Smittium culicis]
RIEKLTNKNNAALDNLKSKLDPKVLEKLVKRVKKISKSAAKIPGPAALPRKVLRRAVKRAIARLISRSPSGSASDIRKAIRSAIKAKKLEKALVKANNVDPSKKARKLQRKIRKIQKKLKKTLKKVNQRIGPDALKKLKDELSKVSNLANEKRKINKPIIRRMNTLDKRTKKIINRLFLNIPRSARKDLQKAIKLEEKKAVIAAKIEKTRSVDPAAIKSKLAYKLDSLNNKQDSAARSLKSKVDPEVARKITRSINDLISKNNNVISKPKFKLPIPRGLFKIPRKVPIIGRELRKKIRSEVKKVIMDSPKDAKKMIKKIIRAKVNRLKNEAKFRDPKLISARKLANLAMKIAKSIKRENNQIKKLKDVVTPDQFGKISDKINKITQIILTPVSKLPLDERIRNYKLNNVDKVFSLYIKAKLRNIRYRDRIDDVSESTPEKALERIYHRFKASLAQERKYKRILAKLICIRRKSPLSRRINRFADILSAYIRSRSSGSSEYFHSRRYGSDKYRSIGSSRYIRRAKRMAKKCGVKPCCKNCCKSCYFKVFGRHP